MEGPTTDLNAFQDRRVKDIDSRIDAIANIVLGFFNKALDLAIRVSQHHTVLAGLFDLGQLSS